MNTRHMIRTHSSLFVEVTSQYTKPLIGRVLVNYRCQGEAEIVPWTERLGLALRRNRFEAFCQKHISYKEEDDCNTKILKITVNYLESNLTQMHRCP